MVSVETEGQFFLHVLFVSDFTNGSQLFFAPDLIKAFPQNPAAVTAQCPSFAIARQGISHKLENYLPPNARVFLPGAFENLLSNICCENPIFTRDGNVRFSECRAVVTRRSSGRRRNLIWLPVLRCELVWRYNRPCRQQGALTIAFHGICGSLRGEFCRCFVTI